MTDDLKILWLDLETYSETPIAYGTYRYAEGCEVDLLAYARNDDAVAVRDVAAGENLDDFKAAAEWADIVVAWNAMFDRNALRLGNLKLEIPLRKWRCAMVRAKAHGLPGSLEQVGEIMGIDQDKRKLKEGHDLMMLFCKPRPKNSKLRRATGQTHPEERKRYVAYAHNDVEAMRAICKKLPAWNYTFDLPGQDRARDKELALWHLDQTINDRGFLVDLDLVDGALRAVDQEQASLKADTQEVTGWNPDTGEGLASTTQRDAMLDYLLKEHGVYLPDLRSSTLERALEKSAELDPAVVELLKMRLQVSSTSTSKYKALRRGVNADGRMRGTIQFDGAARTRRAAGRTFQPQNLPSRGLMKQAAIDAGIPCLKAGTEDLVYSNVMLLAASCIRGCVTAPPGNKLVVADLSNIEGRGLVYLSGEEWKLQAFREFDTVLAADGRWLTGDEYRALCLAREYPVLELDEKGEAIHKGADLYKVAYARAFNMSPHDVDKFGRQIGKVMELGLGYEGGVNAFVTFALVYGLDLEEMADVAWGILPDDIKREASDFLEWLEKAKKRTFPMSHRAAVVCESFKRLWRAAHPRTVAMWAELEDLFRKAVTEPGVVHTAGKFSARRDRKWLRIALPSGRVLVYPHPQVDDHGQCSFLGVNQYTHKWDRVKTYSGKLAENATQSFARDILYDTMPGVEAAGYLQLFPVHDEVVAEAPDSPLYDPRHLSAMLSTPSPYALDMPLAAAGFEAYSYKKD